MTAPANPPPAATPPASFKVQCCRARRQLSGGVLICMACDAGLEIPRFAELTEVPPGQVRWPPA